MLRSQELTASRHEEGTPVDFLTVNSRRASALEKELLHNKHGQSFMSRYGSCSFPFDQPPAGQKRARTAKALPRMLS